ncbi:MAG TPA: helix-turn-helix transcriptional regulator [Streptosporangiaceae bacterium]
MSTPWTEPGRGLFSISIAAELTGLHPQTLRLYEQEGLLLPARSSGGTRRYSNQDLHRLHEIIALTSEGVNLAGIRRIFELQEQMRVLQAEIDQLAASAPMPAPPDVQSGRGKPGSRTAPGQCTEKTRTSNA